MSTLKLIRVALGSRDLRRRVHLARDAASRQLRSPERATCEIVESHPYDVPEVLVLPVIRGHPAYVEWVRPEARGMGLGRRLAERRIADARAMGLKVLLADTFAANPEMPALYDALGFARAEPNGASGTMQISPELLDNLLFFRKAL